MLYRLQCDGTLSPTLGAFYRPPPRFWPQARNKPFLNESRHPHDQDVEDLILAFSWRGLVEAIECYTTLLTNNGNAKLCKGLGQECPSIWTENPKGQ